MKFEDIKKEYNSDLLDPEAIDLDNASLSIPKLHAKYSEILFEEENYLAAIQMEYDRVLKSKWEYYGGKMSSDELIERGWKPFPLKILKGDLDKYIDADEDIITIRKKISYQTQKVSYVDRALKEIMSRQWSLKNSIIWRQFMSGG